MQILIVGASGYLGKHAYAYFKKKYGRVMGTYCTHCTDNSLIHFNINTDDLENIDGLLEDEIRCALICAAESTYDACKIKEEESFQINVISTIKLIEKLKSMNFYIVFCSTDSVYDGVKGNYKETDWTNPINEYGKMKLQVEQYIMEHYDQACVFRLSKMLGDVDSERDTFCGWKKMAINKKDIYCIKNNFFSPVYVEDVVQCMDIACNRRTSDVYNVCGNKTYSRLELCRDFLRAVDLKANVYEKSIEEFGFSAARPLNVGMDNQKIVKTFDYKFMDMEELFKQYRDS